MLCLGTCMLPLRCTVSDRLSWLLALPSPCRTCCACAHAGCSLVALFMLVATYCLPYPRLRARAALVGMCVAPSLHCICWARLVACLTLTWLHMPCLGMCTWHPCCSALVRLGCPCLYGHAHALACLCVGMLCISMCVYEHTCFACVFACICIVIHVFWCACVFVCMCSGIHMHKHVHTLACRCVVMHLHWHACVLVCRCIGMHMLWFAHAWAGVCVGMHFHGHAWVHALVCMFVAMHRRCHAHT